MVRTYLARALQDHQELSGCGLRPYNDATTLAELGLDSLALYELVIGIEETFELELDDQTLDNLQNIGELIALVEEKRKKHADF